MGLDSKQGGSHFMNLYLGLKFQVQLPSLVLIVLLVVVDVNQISCMFTLFNLLLVYTLFYLACAHFVLSCLGNVHISHDTI